MNKNFYLFFKSLVVALFLFAASPVMMASNDTEDCCAHTEKSDKGPQKGKKPTLKEITDFKVAFLVKEMELTGDTKQKFEKLYNDRMVELDKYLAKCHSTEKKLKCDKNLSEEDYAEGLKTLEECRAKCMEIETKYDAKFEKILTKKQLFKMRDGERKFRETMRKMPKKNNKKN